MKTVRLLVASLLLVALAFPVLPIATAQEEDEEETTPPPPVQCADGIDNDGDYLVDMDDVDCEDPLDEDEIASPEECEEEGNCVPVTFQCSDEVDNDFDGAADFPEDFSCVSPLDNDEAFSEAQCEDAEDNDGDGLTDASDPGCHFDGNPGNTLTYDKQDNVESHTVGDMSVRLLGTELIQRSSMDGRALIDHEIVLENEGPGASQNVFVRDTISANLAIDPAGTTPGSIRQGNTVIWSLGTIASGQTRILKIRYIVAAVQNCSRLTYQGMAAIESTNDESNLNNQSDPLVTAVTCPQTTAQCSDGLDNDNDGTTDYPLDFSCNSVEDTNETLPRSQCQDGFDNDGDLLVDFPNDTSCADKQDNDEDVDPASSAASSVMSSIASSVVSSVASSEESSVASSASSIPSSIASSQDSSASSASSTSSVLSASSTSSTSSVSSSTSSVPSASSAPSAPSSASSTSSASSGSSVSGTPVLIITNTDNRATATAGETLTYVITVRNTSQVPATNVTVFDILPNELQFVTASPTQSAVNGTVLSWTGRTIQPGATDTFTVLAQVKAGTALGTIINTTAITSGFLSASDTTTVSSASQGTGNGCVEVLNVTYDASGNRTSVTPSFTYTLDGSRTATNNAVGIARFEGVTTGAHTATQTLPSGWTKLSATPDNGTVSVVEGQGCAAVVFRNQQGGSGSSGSIINSQFCENFLDTYEKLSSKKKQNKAIKRLVERCEDAGF